MTHYTISGETSPGAAFDAGWMTSAPHHRFTMLCPPSLPPDRVVFGAQRRFQQALICRYDAWYLVFDTLEHAIHARYSLLASQAIMAIFVLLWGSAAIFIRRGLGNASPMALLVFRFLIVLVALAPLAIVRRHWLSALGIRLQTAATSLIPIGGYLVCYFEVMTNGVTPGLITAIMGIQPIPALCVMERRLQGRRLSGLPTALMGLMLLVWRSLAASPTVMVGILFTLAVLLLMTSGALWQKCSRQASADVLPLQYAASLGLCLLIASISGFQFTVDAGLIIPVLPLGLLISVVAQLLLYRLLSTGNIVNVTSLSYPVPVITALLDYLLLGNRLSVAAMVGIVTIIGGIVLVFRTAEVRAG